MPPITQDGSGAIVYTDASRQATQLAAPKDTEFAVVDADDQLKQVAISVSRGSAGKATATLVVPVGASNTTITMPSATSSLAVNPMTTLGDTVYGGASGAETRLAGSTSASEAMLVQTGNGTISAAPSWTAVNAKVIGQVLTGYTSGAGTVSAADSILQAIQKLNGNIAALSTNTEAWSGYHANDSSWARTNTAYGDPTADASSTFTEVYNSNFGTVTSYLSAGNKLPGIVFTPTAANQHYRVSAVFKANVGLGEVMSFRLTDGTTHICESQSAGYTALSTQSVALTGIWKSTGTSAVTISIQSAATSGAVTISTNGSTVNRGAVEWAIEKIK